MEGAHDCVPEPIHGVGEHADQLQQDVAGHSQLHRLGQYAQRGNVGLGARPGVVPVENLHQFGDDGFGETELSGSIEEAHSATAARVELLVKAEQIALAGGHRCQLLGADAARSGELDQPHAV